MQGGFALAQSPLEEAVTLTRAKQYAAANRLLQGVQEPSGTGQRVAFHRLRAAVASGLGDTNGAVVEMRLALQLAPADTAILLGASMAELQAGQLDSALLHAQSAGNNATAKALVGTVYEKTGLFAEAMNAWREAIVLEPGNEAYRITLAVRLIAHRDFRPAIDLLQQAVGVFPASGRLRTLLGIAQYSNADTEDAISTLVGAIMLDPQVEANYECLTQIVLRTSTAQSPEVTGVLCRWNSTVCSALKLRTARESNDAAMQRDAIAGLRRAPETDAVVARCELARGLEWTDRLSEARTEMEACLRLAPSPQNHYRLSLIYRRLGLADLAKREMALRNQMLQDMTEDTEAGLSTFKRFQRTIPP
jgi:tetratricopeptide (TPR) repeat protein